MFPNNIALDIDKFIEEWNIKYPYDRWWRRKYNVPFGSEQHRNMRIIDMAVQYYEDIFFEKLNKKAQDEEEFIEDNDIIINGKKVVKMHKDDIEEEFENIDLENFK